MNKTVQTRSIRISLKGFILTNTHVWLLILLSPWRNERSKTNKEIDKATRIKGSTWTLLYYIIRCIVSLLKDEFSKKINVHTCISYLLGCILKPQMWSTLGHRRYFTSLRWSSAEFFEMQMWISHHNYSSPRKIIYLTRSWRRNCLLLFCLCYVYGMLENSIW